MQLLTEPSLELWYKEINAMLNGKRDVTIGKLGTPFAHVQNLLDSSPREIQNEAKRCFFLAVNEHINNESFNTPKQVFILMNICSRFRLYEYFEYILKKLDAELFFDKTDIKIREETYFEFCVYIKDYILSDDFFRMGEWQKKNLIKFFKKIWSVNESLLILSVYIRICLDDKSFKKNDQFFKNSQITNNVLRYIFKTPQSKINSSICNFWGNSCISNYSEFKRTLDETGWSITSNLRDIYKINHDEETTLSFYLIDDEIWKEMSRKEELKNDIHKNQRLDRYIGNK